MVAANAGRTFNLGLEIVAKIGIKRLIVWDIKHNFLVGKD